MASSSSELASSTVIWIGTGVQLSSSNAFWVSIVFFSGSFENRSFQKTKNKSVYISKYPFI